MSRSGVLGLVSMLAVSAMRRVLALGGVFCMRRVIYRRMLRAWHQMVA